MRARRTLLWMVGIALALRLIVMLFVYQQNLDPQADHWSFGFEEGRVARAIASGQRFSNSLYAPTGPTAWFAPIYPAILAGVFKIFGIYSNEPGDSFVQESTFDAHLHSHFLFRTQELRRGRGEIGRVDLGAFSRRDLRAEQPDLGHLAGHAAAGGAYIENHPGWYAWMVMRGVVNIWTNFWSFSKAYRQRGPFALVTVPLYTLLSALTLLGLWRPFREKGIGIAMPYAVVLFFFPIIYYLTHTGDWYRRPIDPLFVALAAYEAAVLIAARRVREFERANAEAGLLPLP